MALFLLITSINLAFSSVCLYFFHGEGCPHCAKVEPFIANLSTDPNIEIYSFEVYRNSTNAEFLQKMFDQYSVPNDERGVPIVFIGDKYLVGDEEILNSLEDEISTHSSLPCPTLTNASSNSVSISAKETISFIAITTAALLDSINPCAIAVLLVLLSSLHLSSRDRKRSTLAGMFFIAGVYIMYFLFGLGLLSIVRLSGLSEIIYTLIGFLAIIVGIFNIKDYFKRGALGFVMEIPISWRPKIKKMMDSITSPLGAFTIGLAICFFELPCTGGPYFFALGIMARLNSMTKVALILLYYNFIFVLPLLLINLLFFLYGKRFLNKTKKVKDKNRDYIHLITGAIMIVLGLLILFRFI